MFVSIILCISIKYRIRQAANPTIEYQASYSLEMNIKVGGLLSKTRMKQKVEEESCEQEHGSQKLDEKVIRNFVSFSIKQTVIVTDKFISTEGY